MSFRLGLLIAGMCGSLFACDAERERSGKPAVAASEHAAAHAPGAAPAKAVTAPAGAKVQFVQPADGATLSGPLVDGKVTVLVKMGVEGIAVRPAGEQVDGTGHHHIIVDGQGIPLGAVVPKDETHLHFGQGETEAEVALTPGPHTLTLQFADGAHLSYGPQLATTIKITVKAP